jgi:hypothetical protein
MQDYLTLGPTPCEETCQPVGMPTYDHGKAIKESRVYKAQLERMHGEPPDGAYFKVKSFPHDFGSYMEVVIMFDSDDEKAREYAYKVEANCPANWDEIAKSQLVELPTGPSSVMTFGAVLKHKFDK